jgi:hypothetical protein
MAVSQEQVDAWFAANPNATAEDVAAAVQSIGGLEANQGLAGMLANRFDIADQEVTNYYNAYTAPTTNEYFKANQDVADAYKQNTYGMTPQEFADYHYTNYGANEGRASSTAGTTPTTNTQTFTDTITSGTPTTQAELLTALADTTTATGNTAATTNTTGNTTATGTTGNTSTTTGNWPSIIYGTTDEDGGRLTTTTTSDGTPFYLRDEDGGGMYQNPNTVESYAPVTGADGKTYYAVYAPVFSSGKQWNETPITGYLTEAQYNALRGGSTFGDAIMNIANSPVGQFALSVLGPYGQAFNAANQASQGNIPGAVLSGLSAAQGFGVTNIGGFDIKDVQNVARGLNAIDKNDLMGALTAGSNLVGGIPGDYTTVSNLASATLSLKNNDTAGFLSAVGNLTGSSDAKTAAAAAKLLTAISSDNPNLSNIQAAAAGLNTAVKNTGTTGTAGTTGSTTVGDFEDTEVTRLKGLGYTKEQIQEYFRNLDNLTGALDETTTTGLTGNATINADATLFNNSLGALDALDTTRSADEFADFLQSIGITNATQLADSGLSNQDILDMINAGVDTVTVTGGTGTGQITGSDGTSTTTGSTGTDKVDTVTVTDKKGTDTVTGVDTTGTGTDGVDTVTVTGGRECAPGFHDDGTGLCVADSDKQTLSCPEGYEPNDAGTACIPIVEIVDKKCDPGFVYDEDLKQCVAIAEKPPGLDCPEGYEPNEAGTACIPVIEIKDKKCDPGFVYDEDFKMCVPIEEEPCDPGYHRENGVCVLDECPEGYIRDLETGQCVAVTETLDCPEGYEPNEAGTACIPIIDVRECPVGQHRDANGKCVPDTDECAPGFHLENGLCVPDGEECEEGYEKINGACVPVCKEGYIRNLATGVCEKVEDKACPPGQVKNAQGICVPIVQTPPPPPVVKKPITTVVPSTGVSASGEKTEPIYAGGMDEFNLLATLQELLKEEEPKKDTKKSKDKTKMATGGHLDDLLAEQMTVDDLLKLLR